MTKTLTGRAAEIYKDLVTGGKLEGKAFHYQATTKVEKAELKRLRKRAERIAADEARKAKKAKKPAPVTTGEAHSEITAEAIQAGHDAAIAAGTHG